MNDKYFKSQTLKNTIHKVKENYPDCKISYNENDQKTVIFLFSPEKRKEYKLSDNKKTYLFLNDHLILKNGLLNPFSYDSFDAFIEKTELLYDMERKKNFIEKTGNALKKCQEFYNTAEIKIGNVRPGQFDLSFILNDIERWYHLDENEANIHLKKIDEPDMSEMSIFKLNKLPKKIQFRILRTTHPGLLPTSVEFICGIREDKLDWTAAEDAYLKSWEKKYYERFGINAFHVLADVPVSIAVGRYANIQMRHLILIDGSEYVYCKKTLELMKYNDYISERNKILNEYKKTIMEVCKETGVFPQEAVDQMNILKKNAVILIDKNIGINKIRIDKLENPMKYLMSKIERTITLQENPTNFSISIKNAKNNKLLYTIIVNENNKTFRFDIDMKNNKISDFYTNNKNITEINLAKTGKLTKRVKELVEERLPDFLTTPEFKMLYISNMFRELELDESRLESEESAIWKDFLLCDRHTKIRVYPYPLKFEYINFMPSTQDNSLIEQIKSVNEVIQSIS